ncbi:MAG: hypothetical protein ABUT20_16840 [Bacteroidota bacterium]
MKKPTNHGKVVNQDLSIETNLPDAGLLLYLVEMLADRKNDIGYCREKAPIGWQSVETSTVEAFVDGNTKLSNSDCTIQANFISSFIFTCSKAKGQDYNFRWLSSLS